MVIVSGGLKSGIDAHQAGERSQQQARANQQHHRRGDFGDDERAAQAVLPAIDRSARPARPLSQRHLRIHAARLPRRRQPEHHRRHRRNREGEEEAT